MASERTSKKAQIDVGAALHSAMSAAEEVLRRVRRLWERVESLPEKARAKMPQFTNDFTADGLGDYLDKVDEYVRDPIRSRNRQVLISCGVNTDALPVEAFDDSDGIDETARQVAQLNRNGHPCVDILASTDLLVTWIKSGYTEVRKRIEDLERAQGAFVRLRATQLPARMKHELFYRGAKDLTTLRQAEDEAASAEALASMGCDLDQEDPAGGLADAAVAQEHLAVLKDLTGKANVQDLVKGKSPADVRVASEKARHKAEADYQTLTAEWESLVSAARVVGIEIEGDRLKRNIPTLTAEIKRLRKECEAKLGDDGFSLLAFFRGEGSFPEKLNAKQLQRALIALQPTLSRALKGG